MMDAHRPLPELDPRQAATIAVQRLGLGQPGDARLDRSVPIEAPIAIEICGIGYAVMMATPFDLTDYAIGFALSEGLIAGPQEVLGLQVHEVEGGWIVHEPAARGQGKAWPGRACASPAGAGCAGSTISRRSCGLPPVTTRLSVDARPFRALAALGSHQPLSRATCGMHAAAFCTPDGDIVLVREDSAGTMRSTS